MSNWSSGDVIANGIKIHYHRTGGDKPPLVLAHGFSDNGLCWTRVTQVLEKDYDVIMPDARGHGLSEAPEEGYASEDHAADLAGLIQTLGLGKPALMGHSISKKQLRTNVLGRRPMTFKPWQETVGQITRPTLLVTADPDKAIVTPEIARQATEMNDQIRWVRIEGAGHNIRREQFEAFIQAVTEFLSEAYV